MFVRRCSHVKAMTHIHLGSPRFTTPEHGATGKVESLCFLVRSPRADKLTRNTRRDVPSATRSENAEQPRSSDWDFITVAKLDGCDSDSNKPGFARCDEVTPAARPGFESPPNLLGITNRLPQHGRPFIVGQLPDSSHRFNDVEPST